MIFRNNRQYIRIDGYHHLNGSRDSRIIVRDDTASNFKHPYYEHDAFYWKGNAHSLNINGKGTNLNKSFGGNRKAITAISILKGSSLGNELFLAGAVIQSKTATGDFIEYVRKRNRNDTYDHDKKNILINYGASTENKMLESKRGGGISVVKIGRTPYALSTFIPRGSNTDIYGAEETAAPSFPQTWVG